MQPFDGFPVERFRESGFDRLQGQRNIQIGEDPEIQNVARNGEPQTGFEIVRIVFGDLRKTGQEFFRQRIGTFLLFQIDIFRTGMTHGDIEDFPGGIRRRHLKIVFRQQTQGFRDDLFPDHRIGSRPFCGIHRIFAQTGQTFQTSFHFRFRIRLFSS